MKIIVRLSSLYHDLAYMGCLVFPEYMAWRAQLLSWQDRGIPALVDILPLILHTSCLATTSFHFHPHRTAR